MVEARGMYLLDDYPYSTSYYWSTESSPPKVFSGKGVPEICSKFTEEHPRQSAISVKLLCCFSYYLCPGKNDQTVRIICQIQDSL